MQKVQVVIRPVQLELREGVQARLLRAPIEWAAPIVYEASKIADVRPVEPRLARRRIGKTGARQPFPQVRNIAIGNAQCERLRHRLLPHGIHSDVCASRPRALLRPSAKGWPRSSNGGGPQPNGVRSSSVPGHPYEVAD